MKFASTALAGALVCAVSLPAAAAPVMLDFSATVTSTSGPTGAAAEAEFLAETSLELSAFDVNDVFTGLIVVDPALAGVDPATSTLANPSNGQQPQVPAFLEIFISDGSNTVSPINFPGQDQLSPFPDADQSVGIQGTSASLFNDYDASNNFDIFFTLTNVVGLTVLNDFATADFSGATAPNGSFSYSLSGGSIRRTFSIDSVSRAGATVIPLPASALLLLGGLGAFGTLRMTRRSAGCPWRTSRTFIKAALRGRFFFWTNGQCPGSVR